MTQSTFIKKDVGQRVKILDVETVEKTLRGTDGELTGWSVGSKFEIVPSKKGVLGVVILKTNEFERTGKKQKIFQKRT